MKTRLFAALVTLSALSTLVGCGQDSITGPSSERPRDRVSMTADFSNLTVVDQIRYAKVLGYHEVPPAGENPSFAWQVDFSAYVDFLAPRIPMSYLVDALAIAKDRTQDVPEVLSWYGRRELAREVGFKRFDSLVANVDWTSPSESDLVALKRWSKNLTLHVSGQMTVKETIGKMEEIADASN